MSLSNDHIERVQGAHDASIDTIVTAKCFFELMDKEIKKFINYSNYERHHQEINHEIHAERFRFNQ
ncbi:MAG: hypothetical protein Q8880_13120 [Bacteroidota bacterium]|nr:hypothetical protein [Bacteroidota bacterium]